MSWRVRHFFKEINHHHNFGDHLAKNLVETIARSRVALAHQDECGKLLAIGSILWCLQDRDVLWGAGAHHPNQIAHRRHVRCLAVRGPLTLRELQRAAVVGSDCNPLFFDPAILTPLLFPYLDALPTVKGEITVVPHYSDIEAVKAWQATSAKAIRIVNPFSHPLRVAEAIARSEVVISSSLHGLILADALGVPSVPLKTNGNKEPMLKYEDYYEGSGRTTPRFSTDISEALQRDPPHFSYKKDHLLRCLASFPFAIKKTIEPILSPQATQS